MNYKKLYANVMEGGTYKSKEYSDLLRRIFNVFPLYWEDYDYSKCYMKCILEVLDGIKIDYDLIDDNFMALISRSHYINRAYIIDLLNTLFMPFDLGFFGTYMQIFTSFLFHDLMPNDEELIKNLKYNKLNDLYQGYKVYRDDMSRDFLYYDDYELPSLVFGYYYGNNLDLNEAPKVISFYLSNRDYYLDKMLLNGLHYPYIDDDTIPKYFVDGFYKIFTTFIPLIIADYKRSSVTKKRIK